MSAPDAVTPFSALLAARTRDGQTVHFSVGDDWLQGRTAFGGLTSALAAQAMRDVGDVGWPSDVSLRALQVSFVGPVGAGPVEVRVTPLREGKNVRQLQATVRHDGKVSAVALGVYAADRPSSLRPLKPQRPAASADADALASMPYIAGAMPAFLQHFERRWAAGALPFSGAEGRHCSIHVHLLDAGAAALPPELLTVLLADMSPTPVIGELTAPAPSSSVSWALELRPVVPGAGWWRADTEAHVVHGGYVNQSAQLWSPGGELAALGYQVVTVFA